MALTGGNSGGQTQAGQALTSSIMRGTISPFKRCAPLFWRLSL